MRTRATLSVRCSGPDELSRLESVLAPDNQSTPGGLRFSVRATGRSLVFAVDSDSASTAVSTAVALLRDIKLFQEVWLLSRAEDA